MASPSLKSGYCHGPLPNEGMKLSSVRIPCILRHKTGQPVTVTFSHTRACLSLGAVGLLNASFLTAVVPSSLTSRLLLVIPNVCAREGKAVVKGVLVDVILGLFFCMVNPLLGRLNPVRH